MISGSIRYRMGSNIGHRFRMEPLNRLRMEPLIGHRFRMGAGRHSVFRMGTAIS